jgi:hypothetical protein
LRLLRTMYLRSALGLVMIPVSQSSASRWGSVLQLSNTQIYLVGKTPYNIRDVSDARHIILLDYMQVFDRNTQEVQC